MKNAMVLVVRFGVRLAEQRARGDFEVPDLVELLSRRVDEMLADLGLSYCRLIVRVVGPGERPSRFLFSIELEDTICFGPLDTDSNASIGVEQLAELVATTVFTRRDDLLARAVRDGEWERVTLYLSADWIPRPAFDDMVAAAIRHGLNIPNAIDKLVALFEGGLYLDELPDQIEAILATQAEPAIRVHVGTMDGLEEDRLRDEVRERLFFETGLVFPPLKFALDEQLAEGECRVALNSLWTTVAPLDPKTPAESVVKLLRNHAPIFTTTTAVDSALGRLTKAFPMVVFNAIEVLGTASALRVLRTLVDEGVNILDLRTILGAVLEANGSLPASYERLDVVLPYEANLLAESGGGIGDDTSYTYADCARIQLRDQISQDCADQDRVLHIFRVPASLEERLSPLGEDPPGEDETFELLSAIRAAGAGPPGTVVLASSRNRRRLRELIRHEWPHVPVLCEAEISPYVKPEKAE